MTYCVGILLDEGVVLASDSRTNAGIDRVSTFRKMFTFEKPNERFFTLLAAGNLSLTQGVMSLLEERLNTDDPEHDLFAVTSMFGAARAVGGAIRQIHKTDAGFLQQHDVDFLQQCGEAPTDERGVDSMCALHQRLSEPGAMGAALAQLQTTDQRDLLTDIYRAITQVACQRNVGAPPPPPPPSPSVATETTKSPPSRPKPRSGRKKARKKTKKRRGY